MALRTRWIMVFMDVYEHLLKEKNRVFNNLITGSNNQFQNYESRINFHELFKELYRFDEKQQQSGQKD